MDKKAYLYIVEAGQFSFEVEIKELLGKVGDTICISTDGIDPDGFDVKITCIEEDYYVYCSMPGGKSSVSCPLKPSDSAPLKHSTMPP